MDIPLTPQGTDHAISRLESRVVALEQRVEELAALLDQTIIEDFSRRMLMSDTPPDEPRGRQPARLAAFSGEEISPVMEQVIKMIQSGDDAKAYEDLRSMSTTELASQPTVVGLVAAALYIKKGDFQSGLQALERVRTITDDPRLLKVVKMVEAQVTNH